MSSSWDAQLRYLASLREVVRAYEIVAARTPIPLVLAAKTDAKKEYGIELHRYAKRRYPHATWEDAVRLSERDLDALTNQTTLF